MATSPGWITTKPLCGVNDPLGREDTANKYLRGLYRKYRVGHTAAAAHKSGIYNVNFAVMEVDDYPGTGAEQTIYLTNSNLLIQIIKIVGDTTEYPVISQFELDESWKQSNLDYSMGAINALVVYDSKLYAATQQLTPSSAAKILEFDGTTWSTAYSPPGEENTRCLCVYSGNLYAGTYPGGKVYEYNGSSWSESYDSAEYNIYALAVYNGNLYAGSGSGTGTDGKIYVYNGSSWSESYDTDEAYINLLAVYDGKLYAATANNGKLFEYNGSSWSLSHDFTGTKLYGLYALDDDSLLYASESGGVLWTYNGTTWTQDTNFPTAVVGGFDERLSILYAAGISYGKIYKKEGATWNEVFNASESSLICLCEYDGRFFTGANDDAKVYIKEMRCKEVNTKAFQNNQIITIETAGEFTLGPDDAVNKSGVTYHYTVWGIEL